MRLRACERSGTFRPPEGFGRERDFTPAWSHDYDVQRMPEANILFAVSAVVVLGLVVWVALTLRAAKESWARQPLRPAPDVPLVEDAEPSAKPDPDKTDE